MNSRYIAQWVLGLVLIGATVGAQEEWPTTGWSVTTPPEVGLDAQALAAFDADIGEGRYGNVDSMLVVRHGKVAYERYYGHDYGSIYREQARTRGPLVGWRLRTRRQAGRSPLRPAPCV